MVTTTRRGVRRGRLLAVALAGAVVVLPACGQVTDPSPTGAETTSDPGGTTAAEGSATTTARATTGAESAKDASATEETGVEETTTEETGAEETTTEGTSAAVPAPCQDPADPRLADLTVMGADGVPGPAAGTAEELLDLAASCDLDGLVARAEAEDTMVSLGGSPPAEVFDGLQGQERALAMTVLLNGFAPSVSEADGGFVQWPAEGVLDDQEAAARLVSSGLYTEDEVAMMRDYGGYTGWRVVVDARGTWTFMGGGD